MEFFLTGVQLLYNVVLVSTVQQSESVTPIHVSPLCHHRALSRVFCAMQFTSAAQSCATFCDPMDYSTPSLPVHCQLPEVTQTHVHELVMPSNHLILCRPPLLLPSIFPSIRVFSNESVLRIRWLKYWSFSISPSNEHPGLISFRMD